MIKPDYCLTSGTVGLLQQSASLLQGVLVGVALAVGNDQGVVGLLLGHLLALELGLGLPQTKPVGLDVPLGLGVGIVSVLQVAFEIQDIFLSFFFILRDLALPLASVSTAACMFSRPLPMFFLVEANSFSSRQSCARSPASPEQARAEHGGPFTRPTRELPHPC